MRAAVERVLHDVWSHRGIAASLLYPFSLVYLAIARRRAARTTPIELPVPVVVVGNIYVGGTGKTPITIVTPIRHPINGISLSYFPPLMT